MHLSFSYNDSSKVVNVTDYSVNGCDAVTKRGSFETNVCHNIDPATNQHIEMIVYDEIPFNRSTMSEWYAEESFPDLNCSSVFHSYWDGKIVQAFSSKGVELIESMDKPWKNDEFKEGRIPFCTNQYIVMEYIITNQTGYKLLPRNRSGQCFENFAETFSPNAASLIPRCFSNTSELKRHYEIPEEKNSTNEWFLYFLSFNDDCKYDYASIPKRNGVCESSSGTIIKTYDRKVYQYFYPDQKNCSGEIYRFWTRPDNFTSKSGKLVCGPGNPEIRGKEPSQQTYVHMDITNDPYFPTNVAFAITKLNCSEVNITEYVRDPFNKFDQVVFYGDGYCLPDHAQGTSVRGICKDGRLEYRVFTKSLFCWGEFSVIDALDNHGVNEICWKSKPLEHIHITCIPRMCGIHDQWDPNVCSGRGECTSQGACTCSGGYEGLLCDVWRCYGKNHDDVSLTGACGGKERGACIKPDACVCQDGFFGHDCSQETEEKAGETGDQTIGIVVGASSGSALLIFLLAVIFCCVCCCVCICYVLSCCCCVISLICGVNLFQKKRLEKFAKLEHFDVLLAEQEHLRDNSVAHLTIDKQLFEIEYDEIEIDKMLGEGGSGAVVFLAKWRGTEVAFKCFKTRKICSSQEMFDDFEKELNFLASINHPNVIRFYGASMKPPRVGMVLEYCSNGEILEFVVNYRRENGKAYPMSQKLRMCREIISAIHYVHSRNIIHRDIKSENILIDSNENVKLMDFGISRMVKNSKNTGQLTQRVGTSVYMAPELINTDTYDEEVDTFSFAILLWVIFTEDEQPYDAKHTNVELKVAKDPNFRPDVNRMKCGGGEEYEWIKEVTQKCWRHDSKNRYTFTQLIDIFSEKNERNHPSPQKSGGGEGVVSKSVLFRKKKDDDDGEKMTVFAEEVLERIEKDVDLLRRRMKEKNEDEISLQSQKKLFKDENSQQRIQKLKDFFDNV